MYIKDLKEEIAILNKKLISRKSTCRRKGLEHEKDSKCLEISVKIVELKRRIRTIELALIKKNEKLIDSFNNNGRKQYARSENYI